MTKTNESGARLEAKAAWSVVVLYEGSAAQEHATSFCDQMVSRFWAKCEFDVAWWPFALLDQAQAAKEAAAKAAQADVTVFSTTPEGDFPPAVKAWIENWLDQRGEREGMLVALLDPSAEPVQREGKKHHCLRSAAHRGALDYLTRLPPDIAFSIPDSLESYTKRAAQVTSLLDDILHQQPPPPHLLS